MTSPSTLGWNARLQSEHQERAPGLRPARVIAVDRDSYLVAFEESSDERPLRVSLAGRLRHEGVHHIAVGDWVGLHENRIDYLFARPSCFRRKQSGESSDEQVIAAHVDWALVATSLNEDFSPRRVERFVIAAWDAGATPVVLLTKCDLASSSTEAIAELSEVAAGCEIIPTSTVTGEGIDRVRELVGAGQTAVLIGSSGVGKSTLVNALLERDQQSTATIRSGDDKGRHTTTRRELLRIPATGGLIIDTPGIREFGVLASEESDAIGHSFGEIEELAADCTFRDCSHHGEPGCAIVAAVERGELSQARLDSYFKLQRELAYNEMRHDKARMRQAGREFGAMVRQHLKKHPKY